MPTAAGLYYFTHGAENQARPPVVLIHGAGGHHLYWPPQVRRMHEQRVFAIDLPGHGKSPGVGHHTIEDYADEVLAFIQAMNLGRVLLVGHSMGGAVALQAALNEPARVLGLCLLGSADRLGVSPALLHSAGDPSKAAETVRLIIEHSFARRTSARLKELAEQRMLETRPSVLYGDLVACEAFHVTERVGEITAPTLLLFGKEDRMVPIGAARALRDRLKQANLHIIDHAGHMLMLEQPEQVAGLVGNFLGSLRYQPGE